MLNLGPLGNARPTARVAGRRLAGRRSHDGLRGRRGRYFGCGHGPPYGLLPLRLGYARADAAGDGVGSAVQRADDDPGTGGGSA